MQLLILKKIKLNNYLLLFILNLKKTTVNFQQCYLNQWQHTVVPFTIETLSPTLTIYGNPTTIIIISIH